MSLSCSTSTLDRSTLGLFDLLSDLRNFAKEGRVDAFQKLYGINKDLRDYLNLPIPELNYSGTAAHYAALNGHFDLLNYFREISKDTVQKLGKPKAITQDTKADPEYFMHIKDSRNKTVAEIVLDHQVEKAITLVKKFMKDKNFTRHHISNFTAVINKNYDLKLYFYVRFIVEQFLKFLSDDRVRKKLIPKLEACLDKIEECCVQTSKENYPSFRNRVLEACNVKVLDDFNFLEFLKALIYKTNNIKFDLEKFYNQLNKNYELKNYLYCTFLIDEFILFLGPVIFLSSKIPHSSLHAFLDQFEDFSCKKLFDQLSMQLGLSTKVMQAQLIQLEENVRVEFRKFDSREIKKEFSTLDKEISDHFKTSNQCEEVYKIIMHHLEGLKEKITEKCTNGNFIVELQKVINEQLLIDKMMSYRSLLDVTINEAQIRDLLARRDSKEFTEFYKKVWKNSTTLDERKEIFLKILEEIRFLLNKNYLTYLKYLFQRFLKNQLAPPCLEIKPTAIKLPELSPTEPKPNSFAAHIPRSPLFSPNSPTGKANQDVGLPKIKAPTARLGSG